MASQLVHLLFEAIDGEEDVCFVELAGGLAFWGTKLGRESKNGPAALLEMRGDIHNKGWTNGSIGRRVEDFERTMRRAVDWQLLEAGEEAAFVTEIGGVIVVGMAGFPVGD